MALSTRRHRIISTTTVMPVEYAEHDGRALTKKIELTPCDLQLLHFHYNQKGLLYRKPKGLDSFVEHLKRSLAGALGIFYPLAGHLARVENPEDDTVSFHIDCDPVGATFVHVIADDVTVADVIDPVDVPDDIVYSFFPLNGATNLDGVSNPLLVVQVTELVDGFFIAMAINHLLFDDTSFWKFFNTWAQISRHENDIQSPQNDTSASLGSLLVGFNFLDGVVDLPMCFPSSSLKVPKAIKLEPPLKQRMFHFSKEKISELKAKANAEIKNSSTAKISSLQALLANLWVSITRNRRDIKPDEETCYFVVIGLRPRTEPPLPENFIGNAVVRGEARAAVGELVAGGLGWAAQRINEMIATWTAAEARRYLQEWAHRNVDAGGKSDDGIPRRNLLQTGSSPRFDVFGGNDFGWGRPAAVRTGPANKFDGKLSVFEGCEAGSVDFEACLAAETHEALTRDEEFMRTLAA